MKEEWKIIENHGGKYLISNTGKMLIKNYKNSGEDRLASSNKGKDGYHRVYLKTTSKSGEVYSKAYLLHRLVALHFLEPAKHEDQKQVNHIDGDKSNNSVSNLEWVNAYENTAHAIRIGLFDSKGSKHHSSKLEESDVETILKMLSTGRITQRKIAYVFDVDPMTISSIVNGRNWKHISKGVMKNVK